MMGEPLITRLALDRPKEVITAFAVFTLVLVVLAGLPTFWPKTFGFLQPLKVDTDPENMLPGDARSGSSIRIFSRRSMS